MRNNAHLLLFFAAKKRALSFDKKKLRISWPKLSIIFTTVVLLLSLTSFAFAAPLDSSKPWLTPEEQAWIAEHPVLRVAPDPDYPPMEFFDDQGHYQGVVADFFRLIVDRLGMQLEVVRTENFAAAIEAVRNGAADAIGTNVPSEETQQEFISVNDHYMDFPDALITHDDIKGDVRLGDPSVRQVLVVEGWSTEAEYLQKHYPQIEIVYVKSTLEGLSKLSLRKYDYLISTLPTASYLVRKYKIPGLHIASFLEEMKGQDTMMVRKEQTQLRDILQKAFNSISSEERQQIVDRWVKNLPKSEAVAEIEFSDEEQVWLAEHPKLRVANETNWPPYDFVSRGEPTGLSIDLMNLLAERIGVEIDYITSSDWNELLEKANRKELDLFPVISKTQERLSFLRFSEPYSETYEVLVVRAEDRSVRDIEDLSGKTMALVSGFSSTKLIKEHYPEIKIIETTSVRDALQLVSTGQADAAYDSLGVVSYEVKENMLPNLRIAGKTTLGGRRDGSQLRMATRSDWPIMQGILQKALDSVTDDEFLALKGKWFEAAEEKKGQGISLSPEQWNWLAEHPVLRIGADSDWAPIEFLDNDGNYHGLAIDLLNRIATQLGLQVEFVRGSWQELVNKAKQGQLDVFSCVAQTPERDEYLLFTDPYVTMPTGLFAKESVSYISDIDTLAGKKIAVVDGYAIHDHIKTKYPQIGLLLVRNPQEGIQAVLDGRAFAYADNAITTGHLLNHMGVTHINLVGELPFVFAQRLGVRKDWPQLQSILQKAIGSIPKSELNALYNQWVPLVYEKPVDYSLMWKVIAGAVALLAAFSYWNRRLSSAKRAAEDAQKSLEFVQYAVDHAVDMAYMLTADEGRLFYVNHSLANRLGYSREEMIGMTIPEFDHDFPKGKWPEFAQWLMSAEEQKFETTNTAKNGEVVPIEMTARHVKYGDEDRFVAFGRDISERKHQEAALLEAKQLAEDARNEAETANRAKSVFLASMSHELRTPLTAIIGYSHLLKRQKDLPEKAKERAEIIDRSSQHLVQMINDVLEVSKIEAGQAEVKAEVFDPKKLFAELREMFLLQAQERGLQLVMNTPELLPERLEADLGKLRQILINLIGNACKFTECGSVTISSGYRRLTGEQVELEIKVMDTGPGIAPDELKKLFQPFEQGESGRKKGGTGLGLVISRKYARLLGGDLTVDSRYGEGSCFTLTCRAGLMQTNAEATSGRRNAIDYSKLAGLRFLVADDDTAIRKFVADLLQSYGVQVDEAENGEDTVKLAKEKRPDMIIMDIQMPVVDGFEAIRRLKASTLRDVPIMVATASVLSSDQQKLKDSQADCFVGKPIDVGSFFAKIAVVLNIQGQQQASTQAAENSSISREKLAAISEALREQLQEALTTLEPGLINTAVAAIERENEEIGRQLLKMTADFRYKELRELL